MIKGQGYHVDPEYPSREGCNSFAVYQRDESDPENPRILEDTRTIVIIAAKAADAQTVGTALASLGWYREQRKHPHARAWVIAKDFTEEAWYVAKGCPDLTLEWYEVELSIDDASGFTVRHAGTSPHDDPYR